MKTTQIAFLLAAIITISLALPRFAAASQASVPLTDELAGNNVAKQAVLLAFETNTALREIFSQAAEQGFALQTVFQALLEKKVAVTALLANAIEAGNNPYLAIRELINAGANSREVMAAATDMQISLPLIAKAVKDAGLNPQDTGLGFTPALIDGPSPLIVGLPGGSRNGAFVSNILP